MDTKTKIPKVGDILYIEGRSYLSHGADDINGGKVTVANVELQDGQYWIKFKEYPISSYKWSSLEPLQEYLKERFKDTWSKPDPDLREEFNKWD